MSVNYKMLNHTAEEIDKTIVSEETHVNDTTSHITAAERQAWNENISKADGLQEQIDNLIIASGGDSSAEVSQARTDLKGTTYPLLKNRLDAQETAVDNCALNDTISIKLEIGAYRTDTGVAETDTEFAKARVRSVYNLPRTISRITCDYGYTFILFVYEKDTNKYIGRYCIDGTIQPSGTGSILHATNIDMDALKKYPDYRFKVCFKRTDEAEITVEEIMQHSHFYQNNRICYTETFYMDRVGLSEKGNICISNMSTFSADDFYKAWHTKEMIYVDAGTPLKITCNNATNITIYQFNKDNTLHGTLDAINDEFIELSPNCKWIRIAANANEDRTALHMPITVQWETSEYNVLSKQRHHGINTLNIVFPVPDVHGMRDVSEADAAAAAQYNNEIGYSSGLYMLPPNYSQNGKPVDVIIACHSSGGYFNFADTQFHSNYLPYYQYLRDEGYLVVDFWGHSSFAPVTASRPRTYGNPDNMACYEWGIKYILENFNVNPNGIFVTCKSLGGEVGLNLAFSNTAIKPAAVGMLAPAFNLLRRSLGYTKEERFENAWAWGFEGDTETILGDETTVVDYGTIPAETDEYKAYMKANAEKLMGYNPMWNGLIGANLDELCEWSFNLGAGDLLESNWNNLVRVCATPIKIWDAVDDVSTPYSIAKNFVTTLKNGGCMAELRTMPTGTGGHYSVDIGTESNPSLKVDSITTRLGITHENIPLAYVELVNYFRRFSA